MLYVRICRDSRDYSTPVVFPISDKFFMLDAMDNIRLPYGGGDYRFEVTSGAEGLLKLIIENRGLPPSVHELDFLARKLKDLSQEDRRKVSAVLESRNGGLVMDAINAAYNLDGYAFYPGLKYEAELKGGAMEGEGVFTKFGYLVPIAGYEWKAVYDGESMCGRSYTLGDDEPFITVQLMGENDEFETDPDKGSFLFCPADRDTIEETIAKVGAQKLHQCVVGTVDLILTSMGDCFEGIVPPLGAVELNELAWVIKRQVGARNIAKLKAVCELECPSRPSDVTNLASCLDQYEFYPEDNLKSYALKKLREEGRDIGSLQKEGFDLDEYAQALDDWKTLTETDYGIIVKLPDKGPKTELLPGEQVDSMDNYEILERVCASYTGGGRNLLMKVLCKDTGDTVWLAGDDFACAVLGEDIVRNQNIPYNSVLIQEFMYRHYTPSGIGKWRPLVEEMMEFTIEKYLQFDHLVHVLPEWVPEQVYANLGKELFKQATAGCDHVILRDNGIMEFVPAQKS